MIRMSIFFLLKHFLQCLVKTRINLNEDWAISAYVMSKLANGNVGQNADRATLSYLNSLFFFFFSSCHAYFSMREVGYSSNKDQLLNIFLWPHLLCFRVPTSLFCSMCRTACFPKLLCGSLIIVSVYLKLYWIHFTLLL